jgi:carbon monoxide dehydrogenase subunit G
VAKVALEVPAPPSAVWAVLADGWNYVAWVVGASRIRDVDQDWPAVGSRLHHSVGIWPLLIDDHTQVLECEPQRRVKLKARGWPAGEAHVDIRVEAHGSGSRITIDEVPSAGPAVLMANPAGDALIAARNREALARLGALAAGRGH